MFPVDDFRPSVGSPASHRHGRRHLTAPVRGLAFALLSAGLALLGGCAAGTITTAGPAANSGGPYSGVSGAPVSFNATASTDSTGKTLTYAWVFGDGATGSGATPSHTYISPGNYNVALTVSNTDKVSSTAQTTASIVPASSSNASGVHGSVHGGQQPVSGATIQLWQVGTTGYGSGAATLGSSVLTDAHGYFSITGDYKCSDAAGGVDTLVYITATGGNPGLPGQVNNTAIFLMAALGPCSSLSSATNISMDEVTTVATVYALAQFMNQSGGVGSFGSNNQGLINAFATVNNLSDISSGTALAVTPNGNGVGPQAKLNTLGNILAPCTNSASATSDACTGLFNYATPPGGAAPTTIVGAALNMALYPANNVQQLLGQPTPDAPFQPTVAIVNDWTLTLGFGAGGGAPSGLAVDGSGNVWVSNYGTGGTTSSVSLISPLGTPAANSPFSNATSVNGASALAIDSSNNVWLASKDNNSAVELNATTTGSTTTIGTVSGPYASASLSTPTSVAVDGFSNVWFVNNGSNSLTELPHGNYNAAANFTDPSLSSPRAIAFDLFGNGWVSSATGASVARVGAADTPVPFASFTATGQTTPSGLAIDGSANVWVTDSGLGTVAKLDRNGFAVSPSNGYTSGGLSGATADAIDGSGNVWIADTAGNRISELNSSGVALSAASGFQDGSLSAPVSIAIDGSGNVWVANSTPISGGSFPITVSEVVGAASPAITPLASAVAHAALGLRPGTPQPTANAGGPYSAIAGTSVTFSGSASTDPNSEALTYVWSFGDGSLGSGVSPTHTYIAAGNYTVLLTVTDLDGRSGVANGSAGITAAPVQNPIVMAGGPYTNTDYIPITFNGSGSYDPANPNAGTSAVALTWNFGDGTSAAGPTPVHTYSSAGTFTVSVTGITASGGSTTVTTTATITDTTAPTGVPIVSVGGPYTAAPGANISFSSAGTMDPNSLPLTYSWNFGDGGISSDSNPTYAYASPGVYSVILTVSNGTSSGQASTTATILAPAQVAFVVKAGGPYSTQILQPQMFDASGTNDPSGRQLIYAWDFGDGMTGTGISPIHVYAKQGVYTVSLAVTDGVSQSGSATTQATVAAPPAEAITANAGGPYQNVAGQSIVFNAGNSGDNLGNDLTYSWDFGDGTTGTGIEPMHAYTASGNYTATVTVSSASVTGTATAHVTITTAIGVTITSPTPNSLFGLNTITVSGTTSESNLTVMVNGVTAAVNGNSFTATGVTLREGVNLISATATDSTGGVGTGVVSVILDATAPQVSITSPLDGSTVTSSQIAVAGLVNDIVTGTVGSNDVTVTVNGQAAQVANRSYLLPSLQLVPGSNTVTVVAKDNVGNIGQTTETIQLLPPTSQLSIAKISGDGQTAAVQTALPQVLTVQLLSAAGTPVAGRPLTFTVSRSDGVVEVMPTTAQSLTVTSDINGKASVLFKLGSRSGLGINQVSVTTPGAAGSALFTETSTAGAPAQIHIVQGDNQRGLLGEQLAEGMQAIVQDAGGNPVPGVTVNYTAVGATDGTIDNPGPVTDSNGRVLANLTLGQQEGIQNYITTADFAGDAAGNAVTFEASAYAPGPVANTSVSGVVLDNSNNPVPNATVTITGTSLSTVTSTSGQFLISGAPVGIITFTVDGSTATTAETLPFLSFVLQDLPGQNNSLPKPIFLPAIDVNDAQTVGGSDPVTLTMAGVPGVAFTVAPNSVTFPDGSTVGKLSLSQVKSDEVPMEPSNGTAPNLIWTLQPAGTRFSVPVQVTLPNTLGLAPGFVSEMYQYDHDLEQFVSAGTGHVSADGSVIVSDPGFGITKAGWGHGGVPGSPFGCVQSCISTNPCISATYSPSHCLCYDKILVNQTCGAYIPLEIGDNVFINLSCQDIGHCDANGNCTGKFQRGGMPCQPAKNDVCVNGFFCNGNGKCLAGPKIPDVTTVENPSQDYGSINATVNSFTDPIKKLLHYTGTDVVFSFQVTGGLKVTKTCCVATQTPNVTITDTSLQATLGMSTPPWPGPPLPFPPYKLGIVFPDGTTGGFTLTAGTDQSLTLAGHDDQCANTDCLTLAYAGGLTITGTLALPLGFVNISGSLSSGLQTTIQGGCGSVGASFGLKPFVATGTVKLFSNANYSITRTLWTPTAFYTVTIPLQ
jgi:PKD repeat protein